MRYRRVLLVGGLLLGFLLGLSLLVAVVLLGYGLPGHRQPKKQSPEGAPKAAQSFLRKDRPAIPRRTAQPPRPIAMEAHGARPAGAYGMVHTPSRNATDAPKGA